NLCRHIVQANWGGNHSGFAPKSRNCCFLSWWPKACIYCGFRSHGTFVTGIFAEILRHARERANVASSSDLYHFRNDIQFIVADGEMPSEALQQSCCRQSDRWASSFRKAGCAFFEIQTVRQGDSIADFIQTMIEKVDCALSVAVQG